jgi:hypothetical protein
VLTIPASPSDAVSWLLIFRVRGEHRHSSVSVSRSSRITTQPITCSRGEMLNFWVVVCKRTANRSVTDRRTLGKRTEAGAAGLLTGRATANKGAHEQTWAQRHVVMSTAIKRLDDGLTIRQMAASKSTRRRSDLKQTALATKECAMWVRLWTWLISSPNHDCLRGFATVTSTCHRLRLRRSMECNWGQMSADCDAQDAKGLRSVSGGLFTGDGWRPRGS